MSHKERGLAALSQMPDDCRLEQRAERLRFLAAIQVVIDQVDRGEKIPHAEVKKKIASWLST